MTKEWTNAELKDWADYRQANSPAARAVLRLLAQEEARGEVVQACPRCYCHADEDAISENPVFQLANGSFTCLACGHDYAEPIYYQRIPAPTGQD